MEDKEWYKIPVEDRISLVGRCGVRISIKNYCREPNRLNAKFCWSHRFAKNPKCKVRNCQQFSRHKTGGLCHKHSKSSSSLVVRASAIVKTIWCMYCGKVRAKKDRQCSACYSEHNICKTCKNPDSKPIITRGGVCKKCPVLQKHKCAEAFCSRKKLGKFDYCKGCGELNGKNMCDTCKVKLRFGKSKLCIECSKND